MNRKFKKACIGIVSSAIFLTPTFSSTISATMMTEKPTVSNAAVDFRSAFNHLLGEHVFLAVNAMQNGIKGTADFNASAKALFNNADDLSATIASVYGEGAGKAFEKMWKDHIGFFVDYVTATANNDKGGLQVALDNLSDYKKDFSAFLAGANPNLKAEMLAQGLQVHVDQLIKTFDSYVNENYEVTYDSMGEAYVHMFGTGAALSSAIVTQFPDRFDNTKTSSPASDLRASLSLLLSEHVDLAVLAMQKGYDGEKDFNAVAKELMENADDLADTIASVYGEEAGKAFEKMWKDHIGYFVDYVTATAKNNEEGRQMALEELGDYREEFSLFLSGANPNLEASVLSDGLQMHVEQLIGAFDSYVTGDYEKTYPFIRKAHAHMFKTALGLSGAIVEQFPDKFETQSNNIEMNDKIWLQIGSKDLILNDTIIQTDVAPFIKDNRTYVSLRFISEALGANVSWNPTKEEVTVKWGNETAIYWIGESTMTLNGIEKVIGTEVFIKDGRTQIPLRFFAELMDWNVEFNESDWSVTLTK